MTPDYQWLIEAAGTDEQRLALLSMLLSSAAIMLTYTITPETKARCVEDVLAIRAAMHEIGLRMGLENEMMEAVKDVWGTTGQG